MKRLDVMDEIVNYIGTEETLEALVRALSDDEATEAFEYITRMYDLPDDVINE